MLLTSFFVNKKNFESIFNFNIFLETIYKKSINSKVHYIFVFDKSLLNKERKRQISNFINSEINTNYCIKFIQNDGTTHNGQ